MLERADAASSVGGASATAGTPPGRPRVVHVMGGAGLGGMERQLLALLPHLARDTEPSLVLLRGGELAERFAEVAPTRVIDKFGKLDPICLGRLVVALRAARPDVVHTWGSTANLWGPLAAWLAAAGRVVVSDVSIDAWKGRLLRTADRWVYARADLVTGKSAAVVAASAGRGARLERTAVVPNVVAVPRRPAGPPDRTPGLVLFLGRLHPDKGPDLLVEAVAAIAETLPELQVVIAGPARQPVERRLAGQVIAMVNAAGLADRVRLVGPVDDPASLLRRAAVLALPSRTEGSPNAVLEAMAHGTPVVATAVGGVPDLLDGGRLGRLVAPGDAAAFGRALAEVIRDPDAAAAVAARARSVVEQEYSIESVSRRWAEIYRQVLA
jgi:glycosyltransferase involved in cell wall biosynthesis